MLFKDRNKCLDKSPDFSYDQACIDIVNQLGENVTIWGQYSECHKCNFQNLVQLAPDQNASLLVNTRYALQLHYSVDNVAHCSFSKQLAEHYRYGWNITEKCSQVYIKEPADNAYLPILSAFIILFCFGTAWYMVKCIYKNIRNVRFNFFNTNFELENDLGNTTSSTSPLVIERNPSVRKHPHRIKAIDVFRGFCLIVMIFVNYGGGRYWFFSHSVWNGLTFADLVFPWFLWIMGLSLTVSLQCKLRHGVPKRQMIVLLIQRSFLLVLLGIVINSHKNMQTIAKLRFPGILQQLGISYFIVGLLEIQFGTKRTEIDNINCVSDIKSGWIQWLIVLLMQVVHTSITFSLNVPGCGRGYLGPGGLDEGGKWQNCTGGAAGYIDRMIFGQHMYQTPLCHKIYETTLPYDPEGLLNSLTTVLMVYMGVQAGRTLNTYQNVKDKVIRWVIWGLITALIGGALCEFKKEDGLIPLNKQLLSLSFVLALSGMAFIIFAILFVLVDITRKWGGRPFFYPGMNSLVLYIGHELFQNTFPFAWTPTTDTHGSYLLMNLWGTAVWVAISIFLYKRNVFFAL